ncbi:ABC transporter permease [Brucella sp. NBRC 12950]|uniref:ABC transporter permease n=1 Tax=Brucella sp. NBRC 12950 TaxID=2994518 RepID=UPI0024A29E81|nr:ABC transporter permease [Brucella sp. NBRC 12950]GLU29154.1 peptide ABC transporter permease [Brucella sp. NBRC 12950]
MSLHTLPSFRAHWRIPELIPHIGTAIASLVLLLALGWAFFPWVFSGVDPFASRTVLRLKPPSLEHWFGTDYLGRDLYARLVHGAALSLRASVVAVSIGFTLGGLLGLVAGFFRGRTESLIMGIIDILLAIPGLLLALAIVTALGPGTVNIAVAVGVGTIATYARLTRAQVLKVSNEAYIEVAYGCGVSNLSILVRHVIPNAIGPALVLAGIEFGSVILSVSALSFLGFGAPPPAPEWGTLISEGRNYLVRAWWLTTIPGLVIVAVVLAVNTIGRKVDHWRSGLQ